MNDNINDCINELKKIFKYETIKKKKIILIIGIGQKKNLTTNLIITLYLLLIVNLCQTTKKTLKIFIFIQILIIGVQFYLLIFLISII